MSPLRLRILRWEIRLNFDSFLLWVFLKLTPLVNLGLGDGVAAKVVDAGRASCGDGGNALGSGLSSFGSDLSSEVEAAEVIANEVEG